MELSHEKGDIVYCERCLKDLFVLTRDIQKYEKITPDQFSPIKPQIMVDGIEPVKCTHCGYGGIIKPPKVRKP